MISKEYGSVYTYSYLITEDDYFGFCISHIYTTPKYRKMHMKQRFLFPVLFVICAIAIGYKLSDPTIAYIAIGIISICWIAFYREFVVRDLHRSINMIKESEKPPYADDSKVVFEEDKMITSTKGAETITDYSAIEKIVSGQNALYLYKDANSAFILPYRIFASEEEKDSFMQFIKQKTNAAVIAGVTK
jgi:hypothetical protein